MNFALSIDNRVKEKESVKRNKNLDLAWELKIFNMKMTVIPIIIGALWTIPKELVKGLEDSIITIGQNTKKSPKDLLSLALRWEIIS